jgi:hypothetical protein
MTKPLECTPDQHDHLHNAVNESRKNAKFVKVDRQALWNLLQDHHRLIEDHTIKFTEYRK